MEQCVVFFTSNSLKMSVVFDVSCGKVFGIFFGVAPWKYQQCFI